MKKPLQKKIGLAKVRRFLPRRKSDWHKGKSGKALIVGGSPRMWGAALLAARAALRVGTGYVQILTEKPSLFLDPLPEAMTASLSKRSLEDCGAQAILFGPGLGRGRKANELLRELLRLRPQSCVLDADGLRLLARYSEKKARAFHLPKDWVLTPHEGEMAALIGWSVAEVRGNRQKALLQAVKKFGCIVLLKGNKTLVAKANDVFEIATGNPALAKAGTGDVLSGMIVGFLAQGVEKLDAVLLAAVVHGSLADHWIKREKKDVLALIPSDLIENLPQFLRRLR